jgi:hypothetical protein
VLLSLLWLLQVSACCFFLCLFVWVQEQSDRAVPLLALKASRFMVGALALVHAQYSSRGSCRSCVCTLLQIGSGQLPCLDLTGTGRVEDEAVSGTCTRCRFGSTDNWDTGVCFMYNSP